MSSRTFILAISGQKALHDGLIPVALVTSLKLSVCTQPTHLEKQDSGIRQKEEPAKSR